MVQAEMKIAPGKTGIGALYPSNQPGPFPVYQAQVQGLGKIHHDVLLRHFPK